MLFAVVGSGIGYTLSPLLHEIAFKEMKVRAFYTKVDLPPDALEGFLEHAKFAFKGLNVTIPFKERAFELVDSVEGVAGEVGAINTILFNGVKSYGYNTDVIGVRLAVEDAVDPKGLRVAILGAGGAARAAVIAFRRDCRVKVFNRTVERAKRLAEELGVEYGSLKEHEEIKRSDVIINATPVGRDGKSTPIPTEIIESRHVVMDMVYRPLLTPLLRASLLKGAKVVDGLKMLVIQGVESERIWLGRAPSWRKVYLKLLSRLGPQLNTA